MHPHSPIHRPIHSHTTQCDGTTATANGTKVGTRNVTQEALYGGSDCPDLSVTMECSVTCDNYCLV